MLDDFAWKRKWKSVQQREQKVVFAFVTEGVAELSDESQAGRPWSALIKIAEARDGFLLYSQTNVFHWIPFSAFASDVDIQRVREFIQQSSVPFSFPL